MNYLGFYISIITGSCEIVVPLPILTRVSRQSRDLSRYTTDTELLNESKVAHPITSLK